MLRKIQGMSVGLILLLAMSGCGGAGDSPAEQRTITIKGSDTMVILGQRWAETYMGLHPGQRIQVTGGGSGTGIAALINGGTDICEASRPMKDKERQLAKARRGQEVVEIPVALDGIAMYVHQSSPLQSITLAQAKAIYTGRLTSWKDLGGNDEAIVPYSRENNSGTYMFFKEHVLDDEDFARAVQTLPGTAAVVNAVSKDPRSIGYGGIAYASGIRAIPVRRDDQSEAVPATLSHVQSGQYPLSRQLFFYTIGEPQGTRKQFIDWVLGPDGQKICETVGYYPLPPK